MVDMSRSHHLYIATDGIDFKIGRTNDVTRRCKFRDMRPLCSWWCPDMAEHIELDIRRTLRESRRGRNSHEWFAISLQNMIATVTAALERAYYRESVPDATFYTPKAATRFAPDRSGEWKYKTKEVADMFDISTSLINNRLPGGREAYVAKRRK